MSKLLLAFPAFVIAIFGTLLALTYFSLGAVPALLIGAIFALLGFIADYVAQNWLLCRYPVAATLTLELWALAPGAFAAFAAAGLILLNVALKPDESLKIGPVDKELLSAVLTALTALLTAGFIKAADDADESWIAPHVKKAFQDRYKPQDTVAGATNVYGFKPGESEIERWVYREAYGGAKGWGFGHRFKRARGISSALASGDAIDPTRP